MDKGSWLEHHATLAQAVTLAYGLGCLVASALWFRLKRRRRSLWACFLGWGAASQAAVCLTAATVPEPLPPALRFVLAPLLLLSFALLMAGIVGSGRERPQGKKPPML